VDFTVYERNGSVKNMASRIHVYKTLVGATVQYTPWSQFTESIDIKLSMEEWQHFIKSLSKYLRKDIDYWDFANEYRKGEHDSTILVRNFSASYTDEYDIIHYWKTDPSDWDGVEKLMTDMVERINERAGK